MPSCHHAFVPPRLCAFAILFCHHAIKQSSHHDFIPSSHCDFALVPSSHVPSCLCAIMTSCHLCAIETGYPQTRAFVPCLCHRAIIVDWYVVFVPSLLLSYMLVVVVLVSSISSSLSMVIVHHHRLSSSNSSSCILISQCCHCHCGHDVFLS